MHAWIVDTSIEYDQEKIDGFLKVSLEALLIVLRNEQYLLRYSLIKRAFFQPKVKSPPVILNLLTSTKPVISEKMISFPKDSMLNALLRLLKPESFGVSWMKRQVKQ